MQCGGNTPVRKYVDNVANGYLLAYTGPMFSGKTRALQISVERKRRACRECIVFRHEKDTRDCGEDPDVLRSHADLDENHRHVRAVKIKCAADALHRKYSGNEVFAFDEAQFFDGIADVADELARRGKHVVVAGLNSDFERKPFENMSKLFSLVDEVIFLRAVCVHCGADAPFTRRKTDETGLEVIGGADKYEAVCRHCYSDEWRRQTSSRIVD